MAKLAQPSATAQSNVAQAGGYHDGTCPAPDAPAIVPTALAPLEALA